MLAKREKDDLSGNMVEISLWNYSYDNCLHYWLLTGHEMIDFVSSTIDLDIP